MRADFFAIAPKSASAPPRLLVFGGSQGARVLNEAMPKIAQRLLDQFANLEIVHQAGARAAESTAEAYARAGLAGQQRVRVQPYLDQMPREFAAADLLLCRSGASTMAELGAAGKASLLVPFALAADDHQRRNAEVFLQAGAACMLTEAELAGPERLLNELSRCSQIRLRCAQWASAPIAGPARRRARDRIDGRGTRASVAIASVRSLL